MNVIEMLFLNFITDYIIVINIMRKIFHKYVDIFKNTMISRLNDIHKIHISGIFLYHVWLLTHFVLKHI